MACPQRRLPFPLVGSNLGSQRHDPQLTRHLEQLYPTLDQLLAAADAARAMIQSPGWLVLSDLVSAEVATIDAELDSGRVLEHRADYTARHGRRGGLRAGIHAVYALLDRAESRLAEQRAKHEGDGESSPEGGV